METATQTPAGTVQSTEVSGLDLLKQQYEGTTTPAPVQTATQETEALENPAVTNSTEASPTGAANTETKTEPELKVETDTPATPAATTELEFKVDDDKTTPVGKWQSYFETNSIPVPEGFTEEKGFEVYREHLLAEHQKETETIKAYNLANEISAFPEGRREEAALVLDILKSGQSLDEFLKPVEAIREWKSLTPEQAVRRSLENTQGWDQQMVDTQMEELIASPAKMEVKYKILQQELNQYEQQLNYQRTQQIESYKAQHNQLREQKRLQDLNTVKATLDRMTTFMDIKLKDENRKDLMNQYEKTDFSNLSHEDRAEFLAWKRYGKQGLKAQRDRMREELLLDMKKSQHNVPQVTSGGTRVAENIIYTDGLDKLNKEFGS